MRPRIQTIAGSTLGSSSGAFDYSPAPPSAAPISPASGFQVVVTGYEPPQHLVEAVRRFETLRDELDDVHAAIAELARDRQHLREEVGRRLSHLGAQLPGREVETTGGRAVEFSITGPRSPSGEWLACQREETGRPRPDLDHLAVDIEAARARLAKVERRLAALNDRQAPLGRLVHALRGELRRRGWQDDEMA